MTKRIKVSLFNRHNLPNDVEGILCRDFDFGNFRAVRTTTWDLALVRYLRGETLEVIVTGLTPALTEFLSEAVSLRTDQAGSLFLLHYNTETQLYVRQLFA